jgi:hypothetical protein
MAEPALLRLARRPPRRADLRAAVWAWRALRSTRVQLREGAVRGVRVPAAPPLPAAAIRGVRVVLRRLEPSCLERALVIQRWLATQGIERDVVVGTHGGAGDFSAHAWVDGTPQDGQHDYVEMIRLAP